MMELASRTVGFRIRGADLNLLCRLAGRAAPDDLWGGAIMKMNMKVKIRTSSGMAIR